jgi:hypothetical protein
LIAELSFLVPGAVFLFVLVVMRFLWPNDSTDTLGGRPWVRVLLPAAAAGVLAWFTLWFVEHVLAVRFLAGGPAQNPVAEASRWTALAYFAAMVLGMTAQTVWHALGQQRARRPISLDKWEFVKPALVAPIVFLAVYQNISQPDITIVMLIFSFQNGFFWQTVLRRSHA